MFLARYLLRISMALNQFASTVTGGDPDMAVSARAGYARERGSKGGTAICRVLEFMDPHWVNDRRGPDTKLAGDHCEIAVYNHEHGK